MIHEKYEIYFIMRINLQAEEKQQHYDSKLNAIVTTTYFTDLFIHSFANIYNVTDLITWIMINMSTENKRYV